MLLREFAFADGMSDQLQHDMALRIENGHIAWLGPDGDADPKASQDVIDASGATLIPALWARDVGGAWTAKRST